MHVPILIDLVPLLACTVPRERAIVQPHSRGLCCPDVCRATVAGMPASRGPVPLPVASLRPARGRRCGPFHPIPWGSGWSGPGFPGLLGQAGGSPATLRASFTAAILAASRLSGLGSVSCNPRHPAAGGV